jgi:DNA-binding transcriptional LysR family regulator
MVALIPASYFEHVRASTSLSAFELPVPTQHITISQMWHPRFERDPAHRWLRGVVLEVCRSETQRLPRSRDSSARIA